MRITASASGLKKAQKRMLQLADPKKIQRVVKQNTAELTEKAQRKAPVSTEKTNPGGAHGQLRRSIVAALEDGGQTGVVKATVDYAEYVELGTRYMQAQPYMKPALEEQTPIFLRDLKRMLAK